jgi:hypothetical protein
VIANSKVFDIEEENIQEFPESSKIIAGLRVFRRYHQLATKIEEERTNELSW